VTHPVSWPDGRLAVISPHLDDGVLSCGQLLAARPGAVVVTVFAGQPDRYPALTSWDQRAGFEPDDDVVAARREEDRAALTILGAEPFWLDFPDTQYVPPPNGEVLAAAIERALDQVGAQVVAIPLGLFHGDHILTQAASLEVLRRRFDLAWTCYADAIYRRRPNLVDEQIEALRRMGLSMSSVSDRAGPAGQAKRRAVECYASQLRALALSWEDGYADAFEPERYWSVTVGPAVVGRSTHGGTAK
jgi:LmbE family N-acetylglucosaminyl deacetylase